MAPPLAPSELEPDNVPPFLQRWCRACLIHRGRGPRWRRPASESEERRQGPRNPRSCLLCQAQETSMDPEAPTSAGRRAHSRPAVDYDFSLATPPPCIAKVTSDTMHSSGLGRNVERIKNAPDTNPVSASTSLVTVFIPRVGKIPVSSFLKRRRSRAISEKSRRLGPRRRLVGEPAMSYRTARDDNRNASNPALFAATGLRQWISRSDRNATRNIPARCRISRPTRGSHRPLAKKPGDEKDACGGFERNDQHGLAYPDQYDPDAGQQGCYRQRLFWGIHASQRQPEGSRPQKNEKSRAKEPYMQQHFQQAIVRLGRKPVKLLRDHHRRGVGGRPKRHVPPSQPWPLVNIGDHVAPNVRAPVGSGPPMSTAWNPGILPRIR